MKGFLLCFTLCIFQVSFGQDGVGPGKMRNIQTRPLHKPETQTAPVIVPVYTPVQQYPVQQYPAIQQYPVQQYPAIQQYPVQQIPVQPLPAPQLVQQYPQVQYPQFQHYPQIHRPNVHHHAHQQYPQYYHGYVPC